MYRMMIVDDDSFVLDGLKTVIDWKDLNIQVVVSCSNGMEALRILEKQQIDILLTDVKMPCMNGLELTKEALIRQPGLKIVIISGYGEFEYAQAAIKLGVFDYLLKPVTVDMIQTVFCRLVKKMNEYQAGQKEDEGIPTSTLNQKLYYDILFGIHNEQTEKEVRKQRKFNRFQIAVVRVDLLSAEDALGREHLAKQIFELLQQKPYSPIHYIPLYMENAEIFFLFSLYLHEEQRHVEGFLKRLQEEVFSRWDITISIGLSECYKDLWRSSLNYRNAKLAVEQTFYQGYNQIIYYDRLRIPSDMDASLLVQSRSAMLEALEDWDCKKVLEKLEDIEKLLKEKMQLDMEQVQRIGIELYSALRFVHNHHSPLIDSESRKYDEAGNKMNSAGTLEELFDILKILYREVLSDKGGSKGKRHKVIEVVLIYVKDNINTNISLAKIAQKVDLSPNYLGKLFKDEMDIGFNEYVAQCRMEMAKKLLKSGKYKVYEVSSMVGYKNPNYFSKIFTEYTSGICPSDYTGR